MEAIFTVDWSVFFKSNVPTFLRHHLVYHFLLCFIEEIKRLYDIFLSRRTQWLYEIQHTSQVIHIEKVLNDSFDQAQRRIYINNVTFGEYVHLWPPEDENPYYLQETGANPDNPLYLLEGDSGVISPDATVYVPEELRPIDPVDQLDFDYSLRGKIDFYKWDSINYQILYYE
jgi:hypothetical protein